MRTIRTLLIATLLGCAGIASASAKNVAADAATSTVTLDACSWDRPGINPFMGDVVAAVDRYGDIPADVRARLKARMAKRQYDDIVSIRRDSIDGRAGEHYGSTIRDMHFGTHQICRSVTRASWAPNMQERGLVYCEGGHCILVPTICRNVSRISRQAVSPEHAEAPEVPEAVPPGAVLAGPIGDPTIDPLVLDEAPSFANPLASNAPDRGAPGHAVVPSDWNAAGFPGSGPNVGISAAPPHGLDGSSIVLTPVPEPQVWALMLIGLAALAFASRRRVRS